LLIYSSAKKYPIYAIQWHAEKNQYEWSTTENIPHSAEAVQLGQYMGNFFISQGNNNYNVSMLLWQQTTSK